MLGTPNSHAAPRWGHSSVLVVGHPGHELRVHGWMEIARPTVCVLTDGSGSSGHGRVASTARVLERTSSRRGPIFGRMSDRDFYDAILDQDLNLFQRLADELSALLVARQATCVVGDSAQGYNPSHDVCRLVINAAVRIASRVLQGEIPNYDFMLVGMPEEGADVPPEGMVRLSLDDDALARKLESAAGYTELASEVADAVERFGAAPFQRESLRLVDLQDRFAWPVGELPFYETYGEKRVAEGVYNRVLRFRQHVAPVAEALWSHSTRGD